MMLALLALHDPFNNISFMPFRQFHIGDVYFVLAPLEPMDITGKGFTVRLKRPKEEQKIRYVVK